MENGQEDQGSMGRTLDERLSGELARESDRRRMKDAQDRFVSIGQALASNCRDADVFERATKALKPFVIEAFEQL